MHNQLKSPSSRAKLKIDEALNFPTDDVRRLEPARKIPADIRAYALASQPWRSYVDGTAPRISEVSQERLTGPKLDYDVIFLD